MRHAGRTRWPLALGCFLTIAASAAGQQGGIEVEHAWARATSTAAKTGVVYLTLVSNEGTDDRLIATATPSADKAELHTTLEDKGVMKMRPVEDGVAIKAGGRTELKPGGTHIMLIGLKAPLKAGTSFPLTLTFEKAGAVEMMVTVEKPGAVTSQGVHHNMPGME
jgi:periplasmic copper chaperone A